MERLLSQLQDLDELRDELDDEEYEETKADTLEQLKEFEKSLKTMAAGKTTLMTDLSRVSAEAGNTHKHTNKRQRERERERERQREREGGRGLLLCASVRVFHASGGF